MKINNFSNIDEDHRQRLIDNPGMWWYRDCKGMKEVRCVKSKMISDRLWELSERITCMPWGVDDLKEDVEISEFLDKGELILGEKFETLEFGMTVSRSHENAQAFQNVNGADRIELWRGFYLCQGLWREHSWIKNIKTGTFIETTTKKQADAYYGVKLR